MSTDIELVRALRAENDALRQLARQHEGDRDRADAYERDLEEIGKAIGCGHLGDGLARCVRQLVEERATLKSRSFAMTSEQAYDLLNDLDDVPGARLPLNDEALRSDMIRLVKQAVSRLQGGQS